MDGVHGGFPLQCTRRVHAHRPRGRLIRGCGALFVRPDDHLSEFVVEPHEARIDRQSSEAALGGLQGKLGALGRSDGTGGDNLHIWLGDDPTPDDGKIDPSIIAKDNLIAYFPFEGDGVEKINNLAPSNAATTKVTFTTGRRGKGFQGNSDGLKSGLLYKLPAGNKLKSLQAFSFSLWLKMVPNTLETKDVPEQMVF